VATPPSAPPEFLYWYWATVTTVHDGDTVDVDLDRGWNDFSRRSLRLVDVFAVELGAAGGPEARTITQSFFRVGAKIAVLSAHYRASYDRVLAYCYDSKGVLINDRLAAKLKAAGLEGGTGYPGAPAMFPDL
jgi:endonuclease YncB( thermonuclease family)